MKLTVPTLGHLVDAHFVHFEAYTIFTVDTNNRIEEIKNFALKAGIKRIGIAHCITFPNEVKAV